LGVDQIQREIPGVSILSRVKISPQERYDLEDFTAQQSAQRTDSKLYTQKFLSESNLILSGFSVSGIGLNSATVAMTGCALIVPQGTSDFSYFISAPSEPDVLIPDADLVDGARNYVEVRLVNQDGTPLTKAFWDPEANSGAGAEFNQIVNTITDLQVQFVVSTGGFSGLPDRLPIAIIDVNGSGTIKLILDRRSMYGRLATPSNIDNSYAWGSKVEPAYALNMTGAVGVFVAGETITIGTETATVVSGGTASITFNVPSGISFTTGDSVTGGTSGATGVVNTVAESFGGVDKSLKGQKTINDAIMTEIKTMKNTRFWWQDAASSLVGLEDLINSVIAPITAGAKVSWNGTVLSITDSDVTPAAADQIAKIRIFGKSSQLALARQDGTGGSTTIAIGDGSVLYVELPASGDRIYSGVGVGSTNYQVIARASFVPGDTKFWLAYREGSKLFFRGNGELQANESAEIGDNVPQTLLDNLGLVDEVTPAAYSSNIRGTVGESLVSRLGVLTDAVGDEQEDRSAILRSDNEVLWDGAQLTFTADIVLRILNTKSGTPTNHTILTAGSPITINDGESVYIEIDRTNAAENVSAIRSSITPIPAQLQTDKDIFVLFTRIDAGGVKYLHLPFLKQMVAEGASFRLGQAGSGGTGVLKVTLHDAVSTTLPTGPTVTVDGIAGVNNDYVLFSNLSSGNNEVYKLSGVGTSIVWTAQRSFNGSFTPSDADLVVVQNGAAFGNQVGQFKDTAFKFNDTIRMFNGTNFHELSAIQNATLVDATNVIVDFSILRNSIKETGTLWITTDGITASVATVSSYLGLTGVTFTADISAGLLRLRYTSTATGFAPSMRYSTKRWSDSAGGPSAITSYSPAIATVANSAFTMSDGSATELNCSAPTLVLGLTQVVLSFAYLVAANPGTTVGDLDVYVNGQRFPRFVSGVTTDGYYTEINSTTIRFSADLSPSPLSIEIIKKV
jgi:hypothetical protein